MTRANSPLVLACVSALLAVVGCSVESPKAADTAAMASDTASVAATAAASQAPAVAVTPAASSASSGMIDPNSASEADLVAIGISPVNVAALIAGRPYANMVAVDRVLAKTLSEQQRDSVYARLWRPININSATADEILLIPGVGPRMRREFQEYRPYTSIEQFRREIGKYVDKAELARLERYVAIR